MWFDNWERDLVDLGFAYVDPTTGIAVIPIKQLKRAFAAVLYMLSGYMLFKGLSM